MAKKKSVKIRRPLAAPRPLLDATPERMAHADGHSVMTGATIERAADRAVLVRRFADTAIDRMYRAKRLTFAQWYAADWYATAYAQAGLGPRVVANYDAGASGGGSDIGGKLLGSEGQYAWRLRWRQARALIPPQMLRLVEALVLEGQRPAFGDGHQAKRYAARIGAALDPIAHLLGAPTEAA